MKERILYFDGQEEKELIEEQLLEEQPDLSKDDIESMVLSTLELKQQDFSNDLKEIGETLTGRILVIADLGLWFGRRPGYKIYDRLELITNCSEDFSKFYLDFDLKGLTFHHDGTNHYIFREIREDRKIENLTTKIYNEEVISKSLINYYTKSLRPAFIKHYGL